MAQLILDAVDKFYGDSHAVKNLNLEIEAGEFVALLGPSGCGKTTTLRMIAGFESLSAGRMMLDGKRLADRDFSLPPEQRHMGMVFQSYALWPHMNVADNVGYPLKMRKVRGREYQRRVSEALAAVDLGALSQRYPQALSGGQRQRVALARCLVSDADVVLLDEPLANLDRHLRASMEEAFRDFHRRTGATLIYVTHDQGEAMSLASQIAVLNAGELVQWSSPQTLYQQPRTEWLARFIGQGSVVHGSQLANGWHADREALMNAVRRGGEAPVLIRPQDVQLHTITNLSSARLPARVTQCIFRGERFEIELELSQGECLLAYSAVPHCINSWIDCVLERGWPLETDKAESPRMCCA